MRVKISTKFVCSDGDKYIRRVFEKVLQEYITEFDWKKCVTIKDKRHHGVSGIAGTMEMTVSINPVT